MFSLPPLPYDYKDLEPFIDTQTMQIHHDKHHQAYVDNLNKALEGHDEFLKMDISELVKDLERVPADLRTKVRNNAGGHFNHSLFWTLMKPAANSQQLATNDPLVSAINACFGDMVKFKEQFTAAAMGRFGSGWAWLVVNGGKLEIIDTPNQDNPLMTLAASPSLLAPILCLDVWEHAYYLKYQNKRKDYIDAWWNVVNWSKVSELYKGATSRIA